MKISSNFRPTTARMLGYAAAASFMLGAGAALAADTSSDPESSGTIVVEDVLIYYAVLPAGIVGDFPPGSPEAQMHGGTPRGGHWHHLLVALFDTQTNERIVDADVSAQISELGLGPKDLSLDMVSIGGAGTFMNYTEFGKTALYTIDLAIERPGSDTPIEAEFRYKHH